MYMGKSWRDKVREKTVDEIEAELVALRKSTDKQVEMELLHQLTYSLQHSILYLEEEVTDLEGLKGKLEEQTGAGSEVFRVNRVICEHRLEMAKKNVEVRKKRLDEITKQLKNHVFEVKSKDLVEDLEAAKKKALEPPKPEDTGPQDFEYKE